MCVVKPTTSLSQLLSTLFCFKPLRLCISLAAAVVKILLYLRVLVLLSHPLPLLTLLFSPELHFRDRNQACHLLHLFSFVLKLELLSLPRALG